MPQFRQIDLTNQIFDKLTVKRFSYREKFLRENIYYWNCQCICGETVIISSKSLKRRKINNCGCIPKEKIKRKQIRNKFYDVWNTMIQNYVNKIKSVKVCKRWAEFKNFYEDMFTKWQVGLFFYRLDATKGFNIENCAFGTLVEKSTNRKDHVVLKYKNKNYTIQRLMEIACRCYNTILWRIKNNWTFKEIINNKKNKIKYLITGDLINEN